MTSDAEISTMAYFAAAKQGNAPQLESMLGSGEIANANIQDELGNTALHYACAADHYEAVQLLCQKGANVNTANNFGDTPIMKATWRGSLDVIKYLALDMDADLDIKNTDGKRAVDLARHLDVKSFLQSFEGDEEQENTGGQEEPSQ